MIAATIKKPAREGGQVEANTGYNLDKKQKNVKKNIGPMDNSPSRVSLVPSNPASLNHDATGEATRRPATGKTITYRPEWNSIIRGLSRPILTREQLADYAAELIGNEVSRDLCAIMAALRKDAKGAEAKSKAPGQAARISEGNLYALDYCQLWNIAHMEGVDLWDSIGKILSANLAPPTTSNEYETALDCIVTGEAWTMARAWLGPEATR